MANHVRGHWVDITVLLVVVVTVDKHVAEVVTVEEHGIVVTAELTHGTASRGPWSKIMSVSGVNLACSFSAAFN